MLLLVDKPEGYTSFAIIAKLKKLYNKVKIGHAGTLDPQATGLLIIAIGKDTKKLSTFIGLDKSYEATIDFSLLTDTRDKDEWNRKYTIQDTNDGFFLPEQEKKKALLWGWTGILEKEFSKPSLQEITSLLDTTLGENELPLTPFSAKKKDGKKLYEYARQGEPIHKNSTMKVTSYEIIDYTFPKLTVRFDVGSGTYIRSLGYYLGNSLGVGGSLTALRRVSIGKYSLPKV